MALIKCTECGKEFSDKAPACPNCGCPTNEMSKHSSSTFEDVFSANKALAALSPGVIKKAKQSITPNENVVYASILNLSVNPVHGKMSDTFSVKGKVSGVFVVTNKRVIFVNSSLGIGEQKELLIQDITSIDSKTSLMNCPIRIKGITEMFVIDCNKKVQSEILNALSKVR